MPDEIIVKHCSPTLAGLKTGNLFTVAYASREEMTKGIRNVNRRLTPKGLRVLPLRYRDGKALVYLYRPARLDADLSDAEASRLLRELGYTYATTEQCIISLIHRLQSTEEFPHEIGLFLGYPPEDVRGFIENKAAGYKCVGCWKVYGDAAEVQKAFCRQKKCTAVYCEQWANGKSIEQLTVAV